MASPLRADFEQISEWVAPSSRVLDLGCADGQLLTLLEGAKQVRAYGVELDLDAVTGAIARGVSVIQADLETGLSGFADQSFDTVILSNTLQAVRQPEVALLEMLRVGKEGIVTFPNFGFWSNRIQVLKGHMPVSRELPYQWYDTPNIHLCTLGDFELLCRRANIQILERKVLHRGKPVTVLPNLFGSVALYRFCALAA